MSKMKMEIPYILEDGVMIRDVGRIKNADNGLSQNCHCITDNYLFNISKNL